MEMSEHEKQWFIDQGAEMVTVLGVEEGNSVIDFGCGTGRYAVPLSQVVGANGNVLAVERDSDKIAVLREIIAAFGEQGPIKILNSEDVRLRQWLMVQLIVCLRLMYCSTLRIGISFSNQCIAY